MTLTQRISELMQALSAGIPEREFCIQLGFLTTLIGEPFYLYGRSGSGKGLILDRIQAAFKDAKTLRIGKRDMEIPEDLSSFQIIIFQSFDDLDEKTKDKVYITLEDRRETSLIISGGIRPEVALNRSGLTDRVTLTVTLPDNISPRALCELLQTHEDMTKTVVPQMLCVTNEEKRIWNESIRRVTLSEDTLAIIGEISKICEANDIYIPIRKWMALSNIIKASAFFNGRKETRITDTFFLGTEIWGRTTSNTTIIESYKKIIAERFLKDIPEIIANPYDADSLLVRVKHILFTSNSLYETKEFNGEECVFYRINIAGEATPLYVPLRFVETDGDVHPFNEWHTEEKRVRCNYHGTSNCTISIDSAVKSIGLRNAMARAAQGTFLAKPQGKFEVFGTLPTPIIRENDENVIAKKKSELAELRAEIQQTAEQQAHNLQILRVIFNDIKTAKDDLFCHKDYFHKTQEQVSNLFEKTKVIIGKIKEAHELIAKENKL